MRNWSWNMLDVNTDLLWKSNRGLFTLGRTKSCGAFLQFFFLLNCVGKLETFLVLRNKYIRNVF